MSKFVKKDFNLIEQILSDLDEGFKLDDISDKYSFTRQYINKIFSKAVGKTPSEYRKIQRFRNVLTSQKIPRFFEFELQNLINILYPNIVNSSDGVAWWQLPAFIFCKFRVRVLGSFIFLEN